MKFADIENINNISAEQPTKTVPLGENQNVKVLRGQLCRVEIGGILGDTVMR